MRVLVAKDGQVIPGQEKLFRLLVLNNAKELIEVDAWLRDNVPTYAAEMANNPITDWEKEGQEELFHSAHKYGNGEIFYDNNRAVFGLPIKADGGATDGST